MDKCPICEEQLVQLFPIGLTDVYSCDCPRCGLYQITRTARINLKTSSLSPRQQANISGFLRENCPFEITPNNLDALAKIKTPSFNERANKFLEQLEKVTEYAGQMVCWESKSNYWISVGWCINISELKEIIFFLIKTDRVEQHPNSFSEIKIKPYGWAHLETLRKVNQDKKQGFVAMWFSKEMQQIYDNVISQAIFDAGYEPHRVDLREHNDKIDDEIIAQIRKSRFVIADFTGHRGGVYFEAGFAKGLGLEVFWSCREDELEKLHFDIRQYNCIAWNESKLDEFKSKITNRIEAVLGHGPV